MSPGFAPRPSLSAGRSPRTRSSAAGVAGVRAPAFVERAIASRPRATPPVSPGFAPRPSLSGAAPRRQPRGPVVSPGFAPRPSLSGAWSARAALARDSVAGVRAPAFVERSTPCSSASSSFPSVAGVRAPAFVERWATLTGGAGLTSVAGVRAPAFVERSSTPLTPPHRSVSPGFAPRPSLSAGPRSDQIADLEAVSPGFAPRPSLSDHLRHAVPRAPQRVAGVRAPAFVERSARCGTCRPGRRVAGVRAPAFVERD